MNYLEEVAKWSVKAAELEAEALELEKLGQASGAESARSDARNVQEHIERLKHVAGLETR